MSVEPGFGGQSFLDVVLPKLRRAREAIAGRDLDVWLQVDGGVSAETIERCAEAGADVFVAGSAVYGADDPAAAVEALRAQAAPARHRLSAAEVAAPGCDGSAAHRVTPRPEHHPHRPGAVITATRAGRPPACRAWQTRRRQSRALRGRCNS
jgi:hypothetical protein